MPVFVGSNCPVRVAGRDLDSGLRLDDLDVCWEFVSQLSRSRCGILPVVMQEVQIHEPEPGCGVVRRGAARAFEIVYRLRPSPLPDGNVPEAAKGGNIV